jgi:uncharacterized repeat protein (TIGR03803 family)
MITKPCRASLCLACLPAVVTALEAQTAVEHVIHTFGNFPNGANPYGTLARDAAGNLYGTTYQGGAAYLGVVFKTGSAGYRVLHSFRGGTDGANPYAGVTLDSAGNLYGTTYEGGTANAGVIYKIDTSGQETVLHSFTGGADGANPYAGVILDSAGNLYGATVNGGSAGKGAVYEVSPSGQESVLLSFPGKGKGANPYGALTFDSAGNLYGTTCNGGAHGNGEIYKLSPAGAETVLHSFTEYLAGEPYSGVVLDASGNMYGTVMDAVYEVDAAGKYTVLHRFGFGKGPPDPRAGLVRDAAGNLYGTAGGGGEAGAGLIFEIDTEGNFKELYAFPGGPGHQVPTPGVVLDAAGNIFGTTPNAGVAGVVYKLEPPGKETTLYTFGGAAGGTGPGVLTLGPSGDLYGATNDGGPANAGVVYKVDSAGNETVLYAFAGGADGATPNGTARVAVDATGNVYGATVHGGISDEGVVYKVDPSGNETVLHTFTGDAYGGFPVGVVLDSAGNLYGTASFGGAASQTGLQEGVVFKLDPAGIETLLYSFTGLSDGGVPEAAVTLDAAGNLYGTTAQGGLGAGVVYEIDASGGYRVLHAFTGGADGGEPYAGVILDQAGNLYGTNVRYGTGGEGVVYRLDPSGDCTALYSFTGGPGGGEPFAGVARDKAGNLYGSNNRGGTQSCYLEQGCGVVYELTAAGQLIVLHSFTGGADGAGSGAVVLGEGGNLYGPAGGGPSGGGLLHRMRLLGPGAAAARAGLP